MIDARERVQPTGLLFSSVHYRLALRSVSETRALPSSLVLDPPSPSAVSEEWLRAVAARHAARACVSHSICVEVAVDVLRSVDAFLSV